MAINETKKSGRIYRRMVDPVNKLWERISFKHDASDCEFADGTNAETKLGAIKGITSDLTVTGTGYAADMQVVKELNNNLGGVQFQISNGKLQYRYEEVN